MPDSQALQQVSRLLTGLTRRNLQQRLLESIDYPIGIADPNILQYLEWTEQNGWTDEQAIIERMIFELGADHIQKSLIPKAKREENERKLEDFMANGTNLHLLEQDLTYQNRQEVLVSGRTDVMALDPQSREVVVELKANDYELADVHVQLETYLGERKNARAIFVAPEIKPALFASLRHYVQEGRITFYQMIERDGIKGFNPFTEKDFDNLVAELELNKMKDKARNRHKRKSEKAPSDPLRTRFNKPRARARSVPVEIPRNNTYSQPDSTIKKVEDSTPLYVQQVSKLVYSDEGDVNVTFEAPSISQNTFSQLESLVSSPSLDRNLSLTECLVSPEEFKRKIEDSNPLRELDLPTRVSWFATWASSRSCTLDEIGRVIKGLIDLKDIAVGTISTREVCSGESVIVAKYSEHIEKIIDYLLMNRSELNKVILQIERDPVMGKLRRVIKRHHRNAINDKDSALAAGYQQLLGEIGSPLSSTLADFIDLKVARARAMLQISPLVSIAYLTYTSPRFVEEVTKKAKEYIGSGKVNADPKVVRSLIEDDNEFYLSFLHNLNVATEPQEKKTRTTQPETVNSQATNSYAQLTHAIKGEVNSHPWVFSNGVGERVQYLTDDLRQAGYTDAQVLQLSESFKHLNLAHKMRHREEAWRPVQAYAFFDDVMLQARQGKVPTAQDLANMYEEVRRGIQK